MLDWMFLILFIVAILFIILSIYVDESESFWKITFIVLAAAIFFILALSNLNIETAYPAYNETSGLTEMKYDPYIGETGLYLSYLFGLFGVLCMIYMIVLLFDTYYSRKDESED